MRIAVIGDPHGKKISKSFLKGVDYIFITGDIGKADLLRKQFFKYIENPDYEPSNQEQRDAYLEIQKSALDVLNYYVKIAPIYFVLGNIDFSDSRVRRFSSEIGYKLPMFASKIQKIRGVIVLNNRFVNLNGFRVGGLNYFMDVSWVREFKPENYSKNLRRAKKESEKAKKVLKWFGKRGVDILLSHNPPYGILDKVGGNAPKQWKGKHAGSKVILDYIKKFHPKYVFCGHIHESKGKKNIGKTKVFNLGCCGDFKIIDIK